MRGAPKTEFVTTEEKGGDIVGIALKADFTAEHEWGIKGIARSFGINNESLKDQVLAKKLFKKIPVGFERLTNTMPALNVIETKNRIYVSTDDYWFKRVLESCKTDKTKEKELNRSFSSYLTDPILGTWDEDDFAVSMPNDEVHKKFLEDLLAAEANKTLAVFVGKVDKSLFHSQGLVIMLADKVSDEIKDRVAEGDREYIQLIKDVNATGIEKKLREAKKGYFALSPRRITAEQAQELGTKYQIRFWLNPEQQRQNNSAWVTVEDLEDWIQDKGIIPKKED